MFETQVVSRIHLCDFLCQQNDVERDGTLEGWSRKFVLYDTLTIHFVRTCTAMTCSLGKSPYLGGLARGQVLFQNVYT